MLFGSLSGTGSIKSERRREHGDSRADFSSHLRGLDWLTRYVAVTGCAGFIGKHLTRKLLERGDYVYGIDALTYAADPGSISGLQDQYKERFSFVGRDIRELGRFPDVDSI